MTCLFNNGHYFTILPVSDNCTTNYDVRLVGGKRSDEGRLEICYDRKWNSFCNYYTDDINMLAITVCRQLGFTFTNCKYISFS